MSEREVVLSARDLRKYYPIKGGVLQRQVGEVKAVDGVSFDLYRGETLGIVGESGCGKSTLGRAILHLEPPTDGTVTFDGEPISTLSGEALRRRRKDLQMVFQDPMGSLDPRQSVEALLVEGMRAHGLADDKAATQARLRERVRAMGWPEPFPAPAELVALAAAGTWPRWARCPGRSAPRCCRPWPTRLARWRWPWCARAWWCWRA